MMYFIASYTQDKYVYITIYFIYICISISVIILTPLPVYTPSRTLSAQA